MIKKTVCIGYCGMFVRGCAVKNVCVHAMRSSLPVGERNAERFAEGNGETSPGAASRDERQVPLSSEKREEGAGFHHIESKQSKRHKARTNRRQKRLMPPLGGCKGGGVSAPLQKTVYGG